MAAKSTSSTRNSSTKPKAQPVPRSRGLSRMRVLSQARSALFDNQAAFRTSGGTFFEAASFAARLQPAHGSGPNAANTEIERVRNRSRRTYVNDAFYRQACRQLANNVVHYGIKPSNVQDPVLLKLWNQWTRESDARGQLDFYGQQWLTCLVAGRDGEGFGRFRPRKPGDMKSGINFQVQLLEADYVPLDKTEIAPTGNIIVSGVERNLIERVVAYHMYDYHPRDVVLAQGNGGLPKRVPASDVLHVYMPDRFSDTRGYPHGAAALNTSDNHKTFSDAHLESKKSQSMNVAFVTTPGVEEDPAFTPDGVGDDGVGYIGYEPNTLTVLPAGHDIKFSSPSAVDPNFGAYKRETLSEIAVAFGLAVEHVTLNFDKLGDRQYRAVMLECQRYFESLQYHMMVRQFSQPIWERFVDEAYLSGLWKPAAGKTVDDYKQISWMNPARGHIHPVQEIAAFAEAVRNGFTSRKRVAASFGEDIEEIDAENARDQERAKMLGLQYGAYPALEGMDFGTVLATSQIEDAQSPGGNVAGQTAPALDSA
ncbi:phage portal protein [Agrobacterium sp. LAD9]|uniref:phage portal protein n=1 Tax=Agrobacterium sp. LAD9 TaxID=2055153 RepID=UPI001864A15E|nr:phage portal protein [Agrobacterium sp. LAD9]